MCHEYATSREHVPPLCLFPEEKDIKNSSLRNDLITVPSCDLHNSKKSKDDEFLMTCLAGIVGNNVIGYIHAHTKVRRAIERKDYDFISSIIKNPSHFNIKTNTGKIFPITFGQADLERLENCFNHMAHGLYFHKFGKRFNGKIYMLLDFVVYEDENLEKFKLATRLRLEAEKDRSGDEGKNPQVFKYEFFQPDEFGLITLQLQFYEGAKVFIAFQGNDAREPSNLLTMLINSGIETTVNFGDKHIVFNSTSQ